MKTYRCLSTLILVAANFVVLVPSPASALNPACEPILTAIEARVKQPAWQSVTQMKGLDVEARKAGGEFYTRMNGRPWTKASADLDAAEQNLLTKIRSGGIKMSACRELANESIDGVETSVIAYHVDIPGNAPIDAKLFIGKIDGLPHAQMSNVVQAKFSYDEVGAPEVE